MMRNRWTDWKDCAVVSWVGLGLGLMMRNRWTDWKDCAVVSWGRVRVRVNDAQPMDRLEGLCCS